MAGPNIILLGRTGSGKSSTGNTLLGREAFATSELPVPRTKEVQHETSECLGHAISVFDTPGISDTPGEFEKSFGEILKTVINMLRNRFPYLLIVIKATDKYEELHNVIRYLKDNFEKDVMKMCIIVITHGDAFESGQEYSNISFKTWCSQQNSSFQDLLEECNERVVLFDNRSKDKSVKQRQLHELMNSIHKLGAEGKRYAEETITRSAETPTRTLEENKLPATGEDGMRGVCTSPEGDDKFKDSATDSVFKKRVDAISKRLDYVGDGAGALDDLSQIVESIQGLISAEMKLATLRGVKERKTQKGKKTF